MTVTDGDGDVATDTADIGGLISFEDDGPSASMSLTSNTITLDESLGTDTDDTNAADDDDVSGNTFPSVYGTAIGLVSGVDLVNTTTSTGEDEEGATTVVSLNVLALDSGLKTTNGTTIELFEETNGDVTGRIGGSSGTVIFAISINSAGEVTVAQYDSLEHPTNATATVATTTEGGTVHEVQELTVTAIGGDYTLTFVDQTTAAIAYNASDADVEAALELLSNIGQVTVTVSVDGDTRVYTITFEDGTTNVAQLVVGDSTLNGIYDESVDLSGKIEAVVTVTDGDGDVATDTVDIGGLISFEDDGPSDITAMPALVANSGDAVGSGDLNFLGTVGEDEPGDVVFTGTGADDGTPLTNTSGDPLTTNSTDNFAILLSGFGTNVLTGWADVDGSGTINPGPDTIVFTIELDPVGDDYTITFFDTLDDGSGVDIQNFNPTESGNPDYNGLDDVFILTGGTGLDLLFSATNAGSSEITVNVSNVGIGTGNQTVSAGELLRIDLVTDLSITSSMGSEFFTITGHADINNFFFTVNQVTPTGNEVTAFVQVFDADDDGIVSAGPGIITGPIGHADGSGWYTDESAADPITDVFVNGTAVVLDGGIIGSAIPGITVTAFGGGYIIVGLVAGDIVKVSTDNGFNRVEITNFSGQSDGSITYTGANFDVGGLGFDVVGEGSNVDMDFALTVTDADGDTAAGTLDVTMFPDGGATITGGVDAEALIGGSGDDTLDGAGGDDILTGGGGDDILIGGAGADTLDGGTGTDTLSYSSDTTGVTVDLTITTQASAGDANGDIITNFENLTGGSGDDSLTGDGSANVIEGGAGADTLTGGGGADTFVYSAGDGGVSLVAADVISDFFDVNDDTIDLTSFELTGFTDTRLDIDNDGSGNATISVDGEFLVTLNGIVDTALTTDDFVF